MSNLKSSGNSRRQKVRKRESDQRARRRREEVVLIRQEGQARREFQVCFPSANKKPISFQVPIV